MANFIEYASKAQAELNSELQRLSDKEAELAAKSSAQFNRESQLDAREVEVTAKEKEIQMKKEELSTWEGKKIREEEVQKMFDTANAKEVESVKRLKDAQDALIEAGQKLDELAKREMNLVEREKSYREEVRNEMMTRFLGVK